LTDRKKYLLLFSYALIVISLGTYFPSLTNGIINWNDDDLFRLLQGLNAGTISIFDRNDIPPLAAIVLWGQYIIGGEGYFIYHAVNVVLHTAIAVLLMFIAARFVKKLTTAFLFSVLFLVHPIRAGTVSWISQQPLVLAVLLAAATIYCYLLFRTGQRRILYYCSLIGTMLFYSASHAGLWLVLILWAIDRYYRKGNTSFERLAPFFVLWGMAFLLEGVKNGFGNYPVMSVQEMFTHFRFGIVENIVRYAMPTSFGALISTGAIQQKIFGLSGLLYPVISVVIVAAAFFRRNQYPLLSAAAAITVLGGTPLFTGSVNGEWLFNDAALYVSSIGVCLAIAALWDDGMTLIRQRPMRYVVGMATGFVIVILMYSTFSSQRHWKGSEEFWTKAIHEQPENIFAMNKLALYCHSRFEIPRALEVLNAAILHAPDDIQSRFHRGFVHLAYMNIDSAMTDLHWVVARDSGHTLAYFNLGIAHDLSFRYDEAVKAFTKAIELKPDLYQALNSRGNSHAKNGNYVASLADYQQVLSINPLNSDIYGDRGMVFLQIGNAQSALNDFLRQSEISPRGFRVYAHIGMTAILTGDTILGNSNVSRAISIDSVNARLYLGTISSTFFRTKEEIEMSAEIFKKNGIRYLRQ